MEKGKGLAFQKDKDKKKHGLLKEDLWLSNTGCSTVINKLRQAKLRQKSKHEIARTRAILPFHGV